MASSDFFLKFEGIEGAAEKADHSLDRLGASFADLGGGILKLVHDAASEAQVPAVQHKIDSDLHKIDTDFIKIGFDFIKLTEPAHKLDGAIANFADQFIKFMPSASEVPFPLAADFLKYEADLKITGLDFLAAGQDIKLGPAESLSLNFAKISLDYKNQSDDQLKISADLASFIKISGISERSALGTAFLKLSGDSLKLADDYKIVSGDFLKVSQDLAPPVNEDGAIAIDHKVDIKFDQAIGQHADDFIKLGVDLIKLNADLHGVGGDFIKLADAVEDRGHLIVPSGKG
ncbi:MAG TPA: hypothetical protein VH249_20035 [Xanthobacteraceae bacterium]|jgi:hypothetical protein|nr:hypothetical protein [Xanthobacteraceae bacterium]